MKKFLLLMFTLICAISLVACSGGGSSTDESESVSVESGESITSEEVSASEESSEEVSEESSEESSEDPITTYTVTFRQTGHEDVVITVQEGEGILESDLPVPAEVVGHTVVWEVTDFSEITEDLVVNAVATPNEYVILYVISETEKEEQVVTYGEEFTLKTLEGVKYWVIEGTDTVFEAGVYTLAENVALTPVFATETNPY